MTARTSGPNLGPYETDQRLRAYAGVLQRSPACRDDERVGSCLAKTNPLQKHRLHEVREKRAGVARSTSIVDCIAHRRRQYVARRRATLKAMPDIPLAIPAI